MFERLMTRLGEEQSWEDMEASVRQWSDVTRDPAVKQAMVDSIERAKLMYGDVDVATKVVSATAAATAQAANISRFCFKTTQERPKSAPYLRLNKLCEFLGKNKNVISELWKRYIRTLTWKRYIRILKC